MLSDEKRQNQIIIQLMGVSILDLIKCLYAKLGTSIPGVDVTLSIKIYTVKTPKPDLDFETNASSKLP